MIIKITSPNDHLMDILFKNPDTDFGLYFKPLKNGQIAGNIVDKHHYEVVFQDEKYSYLPEDCNQIDYQSYCTPLTSLLPRYCGIFTIPAAKFSWFRGEKSAFTNLLSDFLKNIPSRTINFGCAKQKISAKMPSSSEKYLIRKFPANIILSLCLTTAIK